MTMSRYSPGQIAQFVYDETKQAIKVENIGGVLIPEQYDSITLTYYAAGPGINQIETVTYSYLSNPVALLTLTYDGAGRLSTVTRS